MTPSVAQILLPLVLVGAFMMYLGTWGLLFAQKRREPSNRALRLFLLNMLLWVVAQFALLLPFSIGREIQLWRLVALFWIPCTVYFLLFVYRLVRRALDPAFLGAVGIAAAGVALYAFTDLGIAGFQREGTLVFDVPGPWLTVISLVPVLPALMAARLLMTAARFSDNPRDRRAIRLILVGGFIALGTALTTDVILPGVLERPGLPHLAVLAVAILIPFVLHAVMRLGFLAFDVDDAAEELFEDLPDGVVLVGLDGRPRRMNAAARELLGGAGEDPARGLERLLAATGASGDRWTTEVVRDDAWGARTLRVGCSAARRRGTILGRLLVVRDLTERRRAEEVLRRAREALERAVADRAGELRQSQKMEAVGTLASGLAHDLNNLLAVILGFAGAARDEVPPGSALRQDLEEVVAAAKRARDLLSGLLAFGRQRLAEPRPVDLGPVTAEAVRLVAVNLPERITVELRLPEREVILRADPTALHQVVMNLAVNAVQAMRERGGRVTVAVEVTGDGGPEPAAVLTVTDDGPGMEPEVAARALEPFFTTRGEAGGSGLGLSTVARIVAAHGGRITLDSAPGRGTAVGVRLPLATPADRISLPSAPPPAGGAERVLVVDDQEIVLRTVRRLLEPLGYRVAAFARPEEALAAFRAAPGDFDVALTDLAMPGLSGLDLAEGLLALRPNLPVVVMTGNAEDAAVVRGASIGVREMVEKPLERAQLTAILRRALER
jgi:signal transduction histidine kinase